MSDEKPDYVQLAVDAGQLLLLGHEFDSDVESPTFGFYIAQYQTTSGVDPR